ncbi:hypothetical protein FB566_3747 [Stackebrandtia endophytica]|uniref:Uncharacterized protein n=1 Tax=Stackebrandtia endophytica TaxID=1496996 RepID=A0A543B087_9ACTN|nr:DUF6236 family protein [Stackebrandtia endophytica]TQL78170.1 hypothetical protein FB566_3747 [Stackebrandtia endophytica]
MIPRIGLYYPYTHFRDDNWLKLAALYWPGMARIVPPGLRLVDDDVTKALRDDLGFIIDLSPESGLTAASEKMLGFLDDFGEIAVEQYELAHGTDYGIATSGGPPMAEFISVSHGNSSTTVRWPGPRLGDMSPGTFSTLVGIHDDKLTFMLRSRLRSLRLAVRDGDWLGVHPNVAWAYTSLLAAELAKANNLVPVTDQQNAYSALAWTPERFAELFFDSFTASKPHADPAGVIGMLALRLVTPTDLSSVPVAKIIKVRQRHGAQFDAFGKLVADTAEELAGELGTVSDPKVFDGYLANEVTRRFDRPLTELRATLRDVGVESTINATTIKFELPAAAAAMAGGWATDQPVVAGAGAALGLATIRRAAKRRRNEEIQRSPAGYLWLTDRALNPRSLIDRLLRR